MSVELHLLGHPDIPDLTPNSPSYGSTATNACDVNDGGSCGGGGVDLRDRLPDAVGGAASAPAPTHSGKVGQRIAVDGARPGTAAPGKKFR